MSSQSVLFSHAHLHALPMEECVQMLKRTDKKNSTFHLKFGLQSPGSGKCCVLEKFRYFIIVFWQFTIFIWSCYKHNHKMSCTFYVIYQLK